MNALELLQIAYGLGAAYYVFRTWQEILSTPPVDLHWAALGLACAMIWPVVVLAIFAHLSLSAKQEDFVRRPLAQRSRKVTLR